MQTFLPYPNFTESAKVLDRQRLGKQRVEVLQILRALSGETDGWKNHPAVKMWKGYEIPLTMYGLAICNEWVSRGYNDTCAEKIMELKNKYFKDGPVKMPPWMGSEIHLTHQSNLVRKNPSYYRMFFPNIPDDIEYYWPQGG